MLAVKFYHWTVTLFYFYLVYCGVAILFFENNPGIYYDPIFKYGLENKYKYLSSWISVLQTLYFIIVSIVDILGLFSYSERKVKWLTRLEYVRSYLLTSLVLPVTLYIFVVFWGFFLYDCNIIYPEVFDKYVPAWMNHAMHTVPVPVLLVHMAALPNNVNPSRNSALIGLTLFLLIYGTCFWWSVIVYNNWVYLLFNSLSDSQRLIVVDTCYPITILLMVFSRMVNTKIKCIKEKYFGDKYCRKLN